jgi:hypothetical protein
MSEDLETTLRRMTETKVNRRGFLAAVGLTGAAAAIAACTTGSGSSPAASSAATPGAVPSGAPSVAPSAAPADSFPAAGPIEKELFMYNWSEYISLDNIEPPRDLAHEAASEAFVQAAAVPDPDFPALLETHVDPMLNQRRGVLTQLKFDGRVIRYPENSQLRIETESFELRDPEVAVLDELLVEVAAEPRHARPGNHDVPHGASPGYSRAIVRGQGAVTFRRVYIPPRTRRTGSR